jgi:hypothetical protein
MDYIHKENVILKFRTILSEKNLFFNLFLKIHIKKMNRNLF